VDGESRVELRSSLGDKVTGINREVKRGGNWKD
jgi:hypothetical protein